MIRGSTMGRVSKFAAMKPDIIELEARRLCGMAKTFNAKNRHLIPELWSDFTDQLSSMPGVTGNATYGACIDMVEGTGPNSGFVYMAAIEVDTKDAPPEGMVAVDVPAGRYARFSFKGPIKNFPQWIDVVWREYFPASGLKHRDAPDFERYDDRWDPESGNGVVEYYIPIV